MRKTNGFTLFELVFAIAIVGVLALASLGVIWKVFIVKSLDGGVQAIKANVVDTTKLTCVDGQGRELVSYTGLKNACRTTDGQFKITASNGTVRFMPMEGCSPICAGNSPADCGQPCQ